MKKLLFLFLLTSMITVAQVDTEVQLFDIVKNENGYVLKNRKNISNNSGYDNQPYFYNEGDILFASARNGHTDIALYNISTNTISYQSNTIQGGEYSPQRIPESQDISAVRLDDDGLQRLYKYNFKTKKYTELIKDLKIAYPTWYDKNTVVAVTIVDDLLELLMIDLKENKTVSMAKNVGRSVHRIPHSNLVSFISKEQDNWTLNSLDLISKEIKIIASVGQSEDVT